jgi:hypothetical protein
MTRKVPQALLTVSVFVCLAFAAQRPPIPRYEVTGHIAGMGPNHRAVIRATGRATHSATAHPDGTYILRAMARGSYTIRPSHPGYRFAPKLPHRGHHDP